MLNIRGMSIAEMLYVGLNEFSTPLASSLRKHLRLARRMFLLEFSKLSAELHRFPIQHLNNVPSFVPKE